MIRSTLCAVLMVGFIAGAAPQAEAGGTKCLPGSIKVMLNKIRKRFGKVTIASTYRKNARIAKTGRRSLHASCRAVDFHVPRKNYWKAARWLKKNHNGGVGTYSGRHNHLHIDNGRRARWHN